MQVSEHMKNEISAFWKNLDCIFQKKTVQNKTAWNLNFNWYPSIYGIFCGCNLLGNCKTTLVTHRGLKKTTGQTGDSKIILEGSFTQKSRTLELVFSNLYKELFSKENCK